MTWDAYLTSCKPEGDEGDDEGTEDVLVDIEGYVIGAGDEVGSIDGSPKEMVTQGRALVSAHLQGNV